MTPTTLATPARYSLKDLRRHLRAALSRVEADGECILLTRRGKPAVAVITLDDFAALTAIGDADGRNRFRRAYALEHAVRRLCEQFFAGDCLRGGKR